MNITRLSSLVGLSAAILLAPLSAAAAQPQRPGFYFGGSWGAYSIEKGALDDNDDALKAYAGGQFNEWFGIEGSWTDFNRLNNDAGDRFEADGKGLAAVLSFPLGASSLFVKGGHFWWDANSSSGGVLGTGDGDDPFWGVGFRFPFNDNFGLRLEAERYDVADTDLDVYTAGLEFKF